MKLLTVGIPVYNEIDYIDHTINTLIRISKDITYKVEILVVDNLSSDGTREYLKKLKINRENVSLRVIYNDRNEGFNYSYDELFRAASGDYLWVIGGQDLVFLQGLQTLEALWDLNYDYIICNARIKDENLNEIINESLWGDIKEEEFHTLESFFAVLGGPCQALSCNILRTEFIRPHLVTPNVSALWGFIERIMDSLIYSRDNLKIKFIDVPLVEMLIEKNGWQTTIPYAAFTPVLEISELYKSKLHMDKGLLKSAAPFRDRLGILRTCIQARALGLPPSFRMLQRLRKVYGKSMIFWFLVVPILVLPKVIARFSTHTRPVVHFVRKMFRIKTF